MDFVWNMIFAQEDDQLCPFWSLNSVLYFHHAVVFKKISSYFLKLNFVILR
jgi:hypothetical protein